ncbi:WecB/TagA/CpsF family glycosyltransferase [Aliikangiella marina]|uniref:WecB/TagA/CpsF family glycosyltransferase n=1 Tax=Aliikangiella marina TaxID=1712262 RepID=UPI00163DC2FD|nr:WecB/TagA/CpsF family glycosyltransferase [Aliikangiella marina]
MNTSNQIATLETKLMQIHNVTMDEALDSVRQLSTSQALETVVTPNIDHMARLSQKDVSPQFLQVYQEASLCLCDSKILDKLMRMKGMRVQEVITGSTLTANLFEKVLNKQDVIMIVGGSEAVIEQLRLKYPDLVIKHYNPPMGFIDKPDEVEKAISVIEESNANFFFLAVGSPRQEILAKKLQERGNTKGVALCIGASILFLVGEEKRAPVWVQKISMEWFYRMMQDPKRLASRYGKNFLNLPLIYRNI